ncbi:MAG: protoporphyrinogen oxidase [Armatimonadota bacterium]|nr:protoporphyrinogen oxidase [Armatimonadota bacterium]MDR7559705.1 protoporphyrinogen oxidase [Armatimonadota bacterium]
MRVVVVGGGIAGLAAAWALDRAARAGAAVEPWLVESADRLGGKVLTERVGGFLVEAGPDSFLTVKPWALDLCRALELSDRLVHPRPPRRLYVLHRRRLHPLPADLAGLVPRSLAALAGSSLFSWTDKVRMALEVLVPAHPDGADESVGAFFRRRLGRAAVERLVGPLLGAIYGGDPDRLSLAATVPQYRRMVSRHGSLLRAARTLSGTAGESAFATLAGGVGELVGRLAADLRRTTVRTGCPALEVDADGAGYRVRLADGRTVSADAVVVATPAPQAAALLQTVAPETAGLLRTIPYAPAAVVSVGVAREQVGHPLDGHGYLVARGEGLLHTACTWSSAKWPHRAPPGHALLRFYVGAPPEGVADGALAATVLEEARPLLGLRGSPVLVRVHRWEQALPQYRVGHLDLVAAIERDLDRLPGLAVAGAAYRGVGLPDCVRQGMEAAARVLAKQADRAGP